jgi:hypothetical protein
MWQVMHDVPYNRANAGMAFPFRGSNPAQNNSAKSTGTVFSGVRINGNPLRKSRLSSSHTRRRERNIFWSQSFQEDRLTWLFTV